MRVHLHVISNNGEEMKRDTILVASHLTEEQVASNPEYRNSFLFGDPINGKGVRVWFTVGNDTEDYKTNPETKYY